MSRWPAPNMSHTVDPTSPPQTPVTASPLGHRKPSHEHIQSHSKHRHQKATLESFSDHALKHSRFPPQGRSGANTIPFRPPNAFRPDELSPCSSDSSSAANDEANEDDENGDDEDDDNEEEDEDEDENIHEGSKMRSSGDSASSSSPSPSQSHRLADPFSDHILSPNVTASTPEAVGTAAATVAARRLRAQRRPHIPSGSSSPTHPASGPRSSRPNATRTTPYRMPANVTKAVPATDAAQYDGFPSTLAFAVVDETLLIEEMGEFEIVGSHVLVLKPHAIEEPESELETALGQISPMRKPSRHRRVSSRSTAQQSDIDRSVMNGLQDLTCSGESDEEVLIDDDGQDEDDDEFDLILKKQRKDRRLRRLTSGSIGKRTISESIGSDTDTEDQRVPLAEFAEAGSSARRQRRRIGDRLSLQFADPPPPRIDELDEPEDGNDDDDDDHFQVRAVDDNDGKGSDCDDSDNILARELPYYSMVVDSP